MKTNHGLSGEGIAADRVVADIVCHVDVVRMVYRTDKRLWHAVRWHSLSQMLTVRPMCIVMIALCDIRQVDTTLMHLAGTGAGAAFFATHHDHRVEIIGVIYHFNLSTIVGVLSLNLMVIMLWTGSLVS